MSWYIQETQPVYLDYNATTPLDASVEKKIIEGLKLWANPGSKTEAAAQARTAIDEAREHIGSLLHVSNHEVIFTSGGTETNNWVIHSAVSQFRSEKKSTPHVISSAIDHPSILTYLSHLESLHEITLTLIPIDPSTGMVIPKTVGEAVTSSTCLVTIMLANNETGVIQPIADIADEVRKASDKHGTKIFMHTDAAQAIGKIDVDLNKLKVDAVTVVGHKFYGPRIGALVIRSQHTVTMNPLLYGGGQERNFRSGTENTPMIIGLGEAARVSKESLAEIEKHMRETRDYFEECLEKSLKDAHIVHFKSSARLPNTSSVAFPNYPDPSDLLLEKCQTFNASTGATCHLGTVSEILKSCGISHDIAARTVRFSFGRETTKQDIDRVVTELKALVFFSKFGSSLMNALGKGAIAGF